MTTATGAFNAVKNRLAANYPSGISGTNSFFQNEDAVLPDTPAKFIYTEFVSEPGYLAGYGAGRGGNLYRNPARIECYVFVPRGEGLASASDLAESVAAVFRSFRDNDISCLDATVFALGDGSALVPPGLNSDVGNYYCAVCEVNLHFDQVG